MYSKAIHNRPIKSEIVVVGIDVAKRRHVAAIRFPDDCIGQNIPRRITPGEPNLE